MFLVSEGGKLSIRNIWSLQPGECFVAEELTKRGFEVYFPLRDIGVDLLVVNEEKHVGIQVKESRYYISRKWKSGHVGHSWHQIRMKKLLKSKVDFYVFLTYLPVHGEHKVSRFQNRFLIVPRSELEKRAIVKDAGKRDIFSFCFHSEGNHVWDERVTVSLEDKRTDYSQFLEAWNLIDQSIQ
jgi:hypothetical protein